MDLVLNAMVSIAFDGLSFAILLFVISVGLSVTMGLMGFVNLAHGAFAMVGGYVTVALMTQAGMPFLAAVALAALGVAALSVVFERLLYARFYGEDELKQVLLTIGLVFMAVAGVTFVWGPNPQIIQTPDYLTGQIDFGFRKFPTYRVFLIVVGGAIAAALFFGFDRTRIGAQIRAAVDNRQMAESVGINVGRLFTMTFALGSGLAAAGGALGSEILGIQPTFALDYLVFFLIVVAVGGLGSVRGAFVAALLLGVIDNAGNYLYPEASGFFIYVVVIAVLLWRPAGLYGKA
jgi:branched-chain amino acid transport system permease protein